MNHNTAEVQSWIARKLSRYPLHLRETACATGSYHQPNGSRCVFGQLTLSAVPCKTFSFVSRVAWPAGINYEECVIDGIFDVLISSDFHPITGVKFTLEEIGWDADDSVPMGYYFAAREATRKILRLDEDHKNYEREK